MDSSGIAPGQRYGLLVVLDVFRVSREQGSLKCRCRCDCERVREMRARDLHKIQSCGCRGKISGKPAGKTHGKSRTPDYKIWSGMVKRCHGQSPAHTHGGRGIKVCDRWRFGDDGKSGFECFLEDVGPRPSPELSIDRIENDGDYEPGNCRWGTDEEQGNNTRRNRFIEHSGLRLSLAQWAKRAGLNRNTLRTRLNEGWSIERALESPAGPDRAAKHRPSRRVAIDHEAAQ